MPSSLSSFLQKLKLTHNQSSFPNDWFIFATCVCFYSVFYGTPITVTNYDNNNDDDVSTMPMKFSRLDKLIRCRDTSRQINDFQQSLLQGCCNWCVTIYTLWYLSTAQSICPLVSILHRQCIKLHKTGNKKQFYSNDKLMMMYWCHH